MLGTSSFFYDARYLLTFGAGKTSGGNVLKDGSRSDVALVRCTLSLNFDGLITEPGFCGQSKTFASTLSCFPEQGICGQSKTFASVFSCFPEQGLRWQSGVFASCLVAVVGVCVVPV